MLLHVSTHWHRWVRYDAVSGDWQGRFSFRTADHSDVSGSPGHVAPGHTRIRDHGVHAGDRSGLRRRHCRVRKIVGSMNLPLIPAPVELEYGAEGDAFTFDAATSIQLAVDATNEALFAARQLQSAVRDATGLLLAVRKTVAPATATRRVVLLQSDHDLGPEGYTLRVDRDGVTASATTDAGLFYAVQTLR